jgi:hypothetical protein
MTVQDELHWARGHVERLGVESEELERREHVEGALRHLCLAVEGLAAEVASLTGPRRREVPVEPPFGAEPEQPDG